MPEPNVRVKLSAEGVQEVVQALKKIQSESQETATKGTKSFKGFNAVLGNMRGLLVGLGGLLTVRAFSGWIRGGAEAADQIGKLALRMGTTTERASALAVIAKRSDADLLALASAGGILSRRLLELGDGSLTAVDAFARLSLTSKDFDGLDTAEAIALVAGRLSKMETGYQKTAVAMELFGRQGARLIPAMNELGQQGLPEAVRQAEALGQVLDQETADSVIRMNDDLANLEQQSQLLAAQFVGGLAPAVSATLGIIRGEVGATGSTMRELGESAGRVLQGLTLVIGTLFDLIADAFEFVGTIIGQGAIKIGSAINFVRRVLSGENVFEAWKTESQLAAQTIEDAWVELAERVDARNRNIVTRFNALLEGPPKTPKAEPPEQPVDLIALENQARIRNQAARQQLQQEVATVKARAKLRNETEKRAFEAGLQDVQDYYKARREIVEQEAQAELEALQGQLELLKQEGDPERRQLEESRVNAEITRARLTTEQQLLQLTGEEEKAVDRLQRQRLKSEKSILEAQGRTHEARLAAIDEELEAYDLLLRQQGVGDAERAARLQSMADTLRTRADFDEVARQAEAALASISTARVQLEGEVAAGALTQIQSTEALLALERERLPQLQAIADALMEAALATGDPALVAQAQEFQAAIRGMGDSASQAAEMMKQFRDNAEQAIVSDLTDWLAGGAQEAENFGEAMRNLASSVVKSLQRIAAEILATAIIAKLSGLFGGAVAGGGTTSAAGGGYIVGPGSGTSDSIPARLSAGEFVVRAAVVREPGVLRHLLELNRGAQRLRPVNPGPGFADGGLVASGAATAGGESRVLVGLEEGLVLRALETTEGQKVLVRAIGRNKRAIQRVTG